MNADEARLHELVQEQLEWFDAYPDLKARFVMLSYARNTEGLQELRDYVRYDPDINIDWVHMLIAVDAVVRYLTNGE